MATLRNMKICCILEGHEVFINNDTVHRNYHMPSTVYYGSPKGTWHCILTILLSCPLTFVSLYSHLILSYSHPHHLILSPLPTHPLASSCHPPILSSSCLHYFVCMLTHSVHFSSHNHPPPPPPTSATQIQAGVKQIPSYVNT